MCPSSLELMVRRRSLQWMRHILRMDEDRLPQQLRPGHRNIKDFSGMNSSAIRGCHEEGSGGDPTFWDFLKLPGHTKLIPLPEIQAAAAERALDRHAWRYAIINFAPSEFKKSQQAGPLSSVRQPGSAVDPGPGLVNGALCNDCDLAENDIEVAASSKASVK
eukprot:363302-Chlamydomonas_euryale.AAC.13